jgi:hypothetical protein
MSQTNKDKFIGYKLFTNIDMIEYLNRNNEYFDQCAYNYTKKSLKLLSPESPESFPHRDKLIYYFSILSFILKYEKIEYNRNNNKREKNKEYSRSYIIFVISRIIARKD